MRAASFGNAQLMIPMVHSLDQILWVKSEIQKAIVELKRDGLRHAESIPLGIMVEVPSVCYIIDHFCDEVDFFSIGSNDMTQYLYAVDRNNPRVSPLYNPITPSFLRMLRQIITTAHQRGKWVGICGELGGESRYLPLLLGLGLDELSMSSPRIPAVKTSFGNWIARRVRNWRVRRASAAARRKLKRYSLRLHRKKTFVRCWRWRISSLIRLLAIKSRLFSSCAATLALTGVLSIRSSWKKMSGSVRRLSPLALVLAWRSRTPNLSGSAIPVSVLPAW